MRVGPVLAALLPLAAALVPALRASRGGGSSLRRRLAPRDVLEAEFDRLARGQSVVVVDAAAADGCRGSPRRAAGARSASARVGRGG